MVRSFLISSVLMLAITARDAAAQRSGDASTVGVSAKVGGKSYQGAGAPSCKHEAQASIYGVPAALWRVEYEGAGESELKHANLTLWRPKDGGPDQLSLSLRAGSTSHRIAVGGRGEQVGSGKVSLTPQGPGGRFEIKGKDADGKTVETVITCPAFSGIQAEGG